MPLHRYNSVDLLFVPKVLPPSVPPNLLDVLQTPEGLF